MSTDEAPLDAQLQSGLPYGHVEYFLSGDVERSQ
jgi:hypothetical protein